jgi:hypothetical protein
MTDLLHFCFVVIVLLCKVQKIDLGYSTPPDHCSHDKTKTSYEAAPESAAREKRRWLQCP